MSVADRLNKLSTDITNAYTSINNKGGTIPANKNTDNLHTAIDSIEVIEQATAEGESLSLTNTKAMPYSNYVVKGKSEQDGEPSPSNPSEIHSVADDVNLLNLENIENHSINSYYYENIGTNFQLKAGETYTLSFDAESDITPFNVGIGCGSSGNYQSDILVKDGFQNGRISITFTPQNSNFTYGNYLALRFVKYNSSTSYTYSARNIKLQKGTVATPYSPYNQGTVTIKQRGKNLFGVGDTSDYTGSGISNLSIQNNEISNVIDSGGASYIIQNNKLNINNFCFSGTYDRTGVTPRFLVRAYNSNNEQITSSVSGWTYNSYYNAYYKDENGNFNLSNVSYVKVGLAWKGTQGETGKYSNIQLEQGSSVTTYEPYQANDFTFQTEPLRSLPNGVKDTIEADGIHRRVGRVVLDGSENGWYQQDNTSYSEDYLRFTISITDKKNASNPNSKKDNILSNNFTNKILDNNSTRKTNSITGQYSTNLINIFVAQNIINGSKVEDFKPWLSNNPTELLYELEEEIIEPLTQNQATTTLDIIKTGSYEGTTNIYTDEDVKPTIGVGYYKKG